MRPAYILKLEIYISVPSKVSRISATSVNSSALNVSWTEGTGCYTSFDVTYNCSSPDCGHLKNITGDNTKERSIIRSGLSPGTTCRLTVTAVAGNQTGETKEADSVYGTYEKGKL